ncbi:MAG TPA: glucans biosynthesis glucosyltransferase MdoH [Rhodocyclaceae bacterium]|nr:glucans biosynthesis glucosyltransferase MdoH [Rhodocyclaceae bacterium]
MEQRDTPPLAAGTARSTSDDVLRLLSTTPDVPPIRRGSMVARPWHGFRRGVWRMLSVSFTSSRPTSPVPREASWEGAARRRRVALIVLITTCALAAGVLMSRALPFGTSPVLSALQLALFSTLFAWVSAGFWSAIMGFFVSLRGDHHGLSARDLPRTPLDSLARTAIVIPICNEHVGTVFAGLRASCESLATTGALSLFDFYVLSDTRDEALQAEEYRAWQSLREALGDEAGSGHASCSHIFYRVRKRPGKRKAGNLADFCRRWGRNYRYMLVLDADSVMSGESFVSLVRLMEANPQAGIIQTAPRACGHSTLHARAQQFASRITGPLFTAGMQYWQLGESHYWGHNAILRVEPFMRHCALAPLPGRGPLSGDILSHDFVEAALMRRAGYEVWVVPDVEGSYEQVPPNLIAELERDRRWCQGNLLNARLIAEPGIVPVHRAMFVTGVMAYLSAPLWFAYLLSGTAYWLFADVSSDYPDGIMPEILGYLWLCTAVMLMLPRVLGVFVILLRGEQGLFGGSGKLCLSALAEAALSILKAPIRMFAHTCFVLAALTGWRVDWQSPPREAHAVSYREANNWFIGHTLLTLEWTFLTLLAKPAAIAWLLPVFVPLILAVPLTVASGSVARGEKLRRHGLLLTPEETAPPVLLRAAWSHAKRYTTKANLQASANELRVESGRGKLRPAPA